METERSRKTKMKKISVGALAWCIESVSTVAIVGGDSFAQTILK